MVISLAQLNSWLSVDAEGHALEFKAAKSDYEREKLFRYCVAIANEGGGHFILGVSDKKPRQVVGTSVFRNPQKIEAELLDKLDFRVDVHELAHPDGRVLVFEIPSRPAGTAYRFNGAYLMRSGESLVSMTEDKLRSIFSEGDDHWLDVDCDDLLLEQEVIDALDTQTFFELMGQSYPASRANVIARLVSERLISQCHERFLISRIAALLLAKRIDAFPSVSRKALRVIVYNGNDKSSVRIEQVGRKGYAVDFEGLVNFIISQLPQNEFIESAIRRTVKLVSETTIRELVANALVHQDFNIHGTGPIVEIYKDRVEISNPGEPIVPVERFIDGYQSRNERLADIMRRMNICEERSSGIDKVVGDAEVFQLPAPEFLSEFHRTTVVVRGPRSFEAMTKNDRIRACYQHCSLRSVMRDYMTNESLRTRFGLPSSKASHVSQIISATVEAELIRPDEGVGGSRKYARYVPFWA